MLWLEDPCDHHHIDGALAAWRRGDEATVARILGELGVELDAGALAWVGARWADDALRAAALRVLVKAARGGAGLEEVGVDGAEESEAVVAVRGDGAALVLGDGARAPGGPGALLAWAAESAADRRRVGRACKVAEHGARASEMLAAVARAPDDDAPRLVLADWLLERGDAMGELIAASCALGPEGALRGRARVDVAERARATAAALAVERPWLLLRNAGLPQEERDVQLSLSERSDICGAVERFRGHPLASLHLNAAEMTLADAELLGDWLATVPIEDLSLQAIWHSGNTMFARPGLAAALFGAAPFPRLRRLAVDDPSGAEAWLPPLLARAPELRRLEVDSPDIGQGGFVAAAGAFLGFLELATELTALALRPPLDARGYRLLAGCGWPLSELTFVAAPPDLHALHGAALLRSLGRLDVGLVDGATADGFEAFAQSLTAPPRDLALHVVDAHYHYPVEADAELASAILRGLASAAPWVADGHALSLSGLPFDDAALHAFARAPRRAQPRRLRLRRAALRAREVALLGRAGLFSRAAEVDLRDNALGDEGAIALLDQLRGCATLSLADNRVGPELARALAASKQALALVELDLSGSELGDDGALALAAAALPRLSRLDLRRAAIADVGVAAIERAPWFAALECDPFGRDILGPGR